MTLQRFLSIQRLSIASRKVFEKTRIKPSHLLRWQSSKVPQGSRGGVGWVRLTVYGLTTTSLALGGTLAYANYDPIFKESVNSYVPGFSALTDFAADKWVDFIDYVNPKQSPNVGLKGERPKAKEEIDLVALKKETAKTKISEQTGPHSQVKRRDEAVVELKGTPPVVERDQIKAVSEGQESSSKGTVPTDKGLKQEQQLAAKVSSAAQEPQTIDKSEKVMETKEKLVEAKQPETREGKTKEIIGEPGAKKTTESPLGVAASEEPKAGVKEKEALGAEVKSVVALVKEEADKMAQEIPTKGQQAVKMADEHLSWLKDSAEVDGKLQEVYKTYLSLSERVLEAQKSLIKAIKAHHHSLTESTKIPADEAAVAKDIASSEDAVQAAKRDLETAQEEHKKTSTMLKSLLDSAMNLGLWSKVEQMEEKIAKVASELLAGADETESNSKMLEEYEQEAQRTREELQRELEARLPEGDTQHEALLLMLQRKLEDLKRQLEDKEVEHSQQMTAAMEEQKEKLEQLAEVRLKSLLQEQEHKFQQELHHKLDEVNRESASELREQLKIQKEAQTVHLAESMEMQATELGEKWASELEAQLRDQEHSYQRKLAGAFAQLKGIESMVNTVANAGEMTRKQQGLRTACDTLNSALQQANSNPDPTERYSFSTEITAVRESSQGDPFIPSVLDSLPQTAVMGIQSEAGLKERFKKVKRICKRVALVPETGGGLGTYALSYIQSLLTISTWTSSAVDGTPPSRNMDTFNLLSLADAHLNQGSLEGAVQAMNCLEGEPRRVAQDWLRDARLYLETSQTVALISQYIAATSISIVH